MSDAVMVLLDTIGEGLLGLWALFGALRLWNGVLDQAEGREDRDAD